MKLDELERLLEAYQKKPTTHFEDDLESIGVCLHCGQELAAHDYYGGEACLSDATPLANALVDAAPALLKLWRGASGVAPWIAQDMRHQSDHCKHECGCGFDETEPYWNELTAALAELEGK